MSVIHLVVGIALVLGVMILVHEWGHFIVARLFRVRVDVFSIGFGPRLFGWKRGATDYRVSALPLGGYVRMAGQDLSDVDAGDKPPTGAPDELLSKPRWQRALICFAGPAVNLIFPILLLIGFFAIVGMPYAAYFDRPVQVVALPAIAQVAQNPLHVGDKLVGINGITNPTWEQAQKAIKQMASSGTLELQVESGGVLRSAEVQLKDVASPDLFLGYAPVPPVLDEVAPGTPAEHAGLREGDRILAANGQKIDAWGQLVDIVHGSNGKPVALDIYRKGQVVHTAVMPKLDVNDTGDKVYQIGVLVREDTAYRRVSLGEGTSTAVGTTIDTIQRTIDVVGKLFSGRVSIKQLQGPVGISHEAGRAVDRGPLAVISLMVLISVNLGILNLLPIPILDGGQILLLAIEGSMRRDLSLSFKERFVQIGLVFLLVLFAIVMYNDIVRRLPIHS